MSYMQNIHKILVAVVFSLFICFSAASVVSANDYGQQGGAQAAPSYTSQTKGNSYQQQTDYSGDRQKEVKQDKSFQKTGNDYQQTKDASSYQQEQSPKQESTNRQQDSGPNATQKEQ